MGEQRTSLVTTSSVTITTTRTSRLAVPGRLGEYRQSSLSRLFSMLTALRLGHDPELTSDRSGDEARHPPRCEWPLGGFGR